MGTNGMTMIRNVVLGRLDDPAHGVELDAGLAGIAALEFAGLLDMQVGRDAGLREGGWTFAIVNDWVDAEAYRSYDLDAEHNRYRAMIAAVCSDIARVQFEVEGP